MAEVFQVKLIKPKKLKVDAFRLELLNALRAEGRDVKKEYAKTTATWRRKPEFEILIGLTGKDASVLVGTDDEIYNYVDQGTRGHYVPKSGTATMAFKPGYKAKTTPRKIGSKSGGAFGERIVRTGRWFVRGIDAREFSPTIQKRRRKPFTRRMVKAMQRAGSKAF